MQIFNGYNGFSLVLAFVFLVPLSVFCYLKYRNKTLPGVGRWALGYFLFIAASMIRVFNIGLPFEWQTALANVLIAALYYFVISGVREVKSRNYLFSPEAALLLIYAQLSLFMIFLPGSYEIRVTLISATIAIFSMLLMSVMMKSRQRFEFADLLLLSSTLINMFVAATRGIYAAGWTPFSFFNFRQVDSIFMLWSIVYAGTISVSLYMLVTTGAKFSRRTHLNLRQDDILGSDVIILATWKRMIKGYVMQDLRSAASNVLQSIDTTLAKKSAEDKSALLSAKEDMDYAVNILDEINDFVSVIDMIEHPNFEPVSLRRLADELSLKWSIPVARQKANADTVVNVDTHLFFIAMGNVIANGLRHGKSICRVDLNVDHDWLIFDVSDDGPGLPEHAMNLMLEVEDDSERPSLRTAGALGVGLLLTQAIVAIHGGQTVVYSQHPSILRLAFPLRQA